MYWSSYGSEQAVCFEELLVADVFELKERSDHMAVVYFNFLMTHGDGVIQNIQLVFSLLYSCYWLSLFEYPCLLEASTILLHSAFHLALR